MKKLILLFAFVVLSLLTIIDASAKIRRVGYFGTWVSGTDYGDLQSAINASASGDTTYIFPGTWSADIRKKVILIGYGYFNSGANSNIGFQNIEGAQNVDINTYAGSDSSVFQGFSGNFYIRDVTKDIKINRCNCNFYYSTGCTLNNWQITQSFIGNFYCFWGYASPTIFSNLLVSNCYIYNFKFDATINGGNSGIFLNNIFDGTANFQNCPFNIKNSIFINGHNNDAYCFYQYNVATNAYPLTNIGNDNNNTNVADISSVFVGYPTIGNYSADSRFAIKSSSVAYTASEGGTQTGIYGGSDPYRFSGIPPIPSFYKLTAPSTTTSTNPYTITFSVRSNN